VAAQPEGDWMLHGVPIVFITALITPKEARDGRRINGHRVIPKPTHGFDLIKVIEEISRVVWMCVEYFVNREIWNRSSKRGNNIRFCSSTSKSDASAVAIE
jgi:hypothetical protein